MDPGVHCLSSSAQTVSAHALQEDSGNSSQQEDPGTDDPPSVLEELFTDAGIGVGSLGTIPYSRVFP